MSEAKIHALNVRDGDCFLLERANTDRVTMIDICCGNWKKTLAEEVMEAIEKAQKPRGDFNMRSKPTNPVDYLTDKGITEIWRFILTHPDMDHMDGIKNLFDKQKVLHFWDCGIRKDKPDFNNGSPYREEDWDFYDELIRGTVANTSTVTPRAGSIGKFYNKDDDQGNGNGDFISIVSPCQDLIDCANDGGDINDASYVIVYRSSAGRIIFPGDSNDKTWEYILENHKGLVSDTAVLFAPHHGRKSDRDYAFLDTVKPRVSFFGCAPSEHLAYSAWQNRDLLYFTNNQCGNIHIYPIDEKVKIFIENYNYAVAYTKGQTFQKDNYWYLCEV